jgi:hypothetical protein
MALTKTDLANIVEGILPVANGGTGTSTGVAPGGSTTQLQYNNAGAFSGSANMTFNGTTLTVNDLTDSSLTAGRVVYAGTAGNLADSASLVWDNTNTRLGINTSTFVTNSKLAIQTAAGKFDVAALGGGSVNLITNGALGFQAGTSSGFEWYNGSTSSVPMVLNGSGNLGIGTASPALASASYTGLEIYGNTLGPNLKLTNSTTGAGAGNGFDVLVAAGSSDAYIYQRENAPIIFGTNGTNRLTLTAAGGVSFGSSGTAYGTSGQYLQSNGDTAPTWVTPTSVSSSQLAKAWVHFNGSNPATIQASYNVSSVTYTSTGRYVVNFTNALADAKYAFAGASSPSNDTTQFIQTGYQPTYGTNTASACYLAVGPSGAIASSTFVTVVFFR